jgi:mycothiol synthase
MDRIRSATPADRTEIDALIARVTVRSDIPALTEYKLRALAGAVPGRGAVGFADGRLVGFAQAAWHPGSGQTDHGYWALEAATEPGAVHDVVRLLDHTAAQTPEGEPALVWAADAGLGDLLRAAGFEEVRRIDRMSVDLPIDFPAALPDGVSIAGFVVGKDEEAWLDVNNRAFAGHPENGAVTLEELQGRMALDWFLAADLLMAWKGGSLVGSCWTKVHEQGIGEIYIIGVAPEATGTGLGRALLTAGAAHLGRNRGCTRLRLYTDTDNVRARKLYESVGLATEFSNRLFRFPIRPGAPSSDRS